MACKGSVGVSGGFGCLSAPVGLQGAHGAYRGFLGLLVAL